MSSTPAIVETPLIELHRAAGATLAEFAGCLLPEKFSDERAEYRAARETVALFDANWHAIFSASGRDAVRYLHAITSNDIKGLARKLRSRGPAAESARAHPRGPGNLQAQGKTAAAFARGISRAHFRHYEEIYPGVSGAIAGCVRRVCEHGPRRPAGARRGPRKPPASRSADSRNFATAESGN